MVKQLISCTLSIVLAFVLLESSECIRDRGSSYLWPISIGNHDTTSRTIQHVTEKYTKDSTFLTHEEDFVTYDYPKTIEGLTVRRSEAGNPERVALISGGPGYQYVTLYFRSKKGQAMAADVEVYVNK